MKGKRLITERNLKRTEIQTLAQVLFAGHKCHRAFPLDKCHVRHRDRFLHVHFSFEVHLGVEDVF